MNTMRSVCFTLLVNRCEEQGNDCLYALVHKVRKSFYLTLNFSLSTFGLDKAILLLFASSLAQAHENI
jgi:hypothetical protein